MGLRASTTQGPYTGRMAKAVVQQKDKLQALQQDDDDDPYGDPQSSELPVQRWRTQIRADTAANATLTLSAHRIRATSEAKEGLTFSDYCDSTGKEDKTHKGVKRMQLSVFFVSEVPIITG